MIELQTQKDNYYEYFVECLAKTTVDFLIDPVKPVSSMLPASTVKPSTKNFSRSKSVNSSARDNNEDTISEKNPNSVQEAGSVGASSSGIPVDSVKSPNGEENMVTDVNAGEFYGGNLGENDDMADMNRIYESDSIYNFELDKMDQPECDDLELLRIHRQNQPVGVWLIAPLITKLQDNCQLKVLEHACK